MLTHINKNMMVLSVSVFWAAASLPAMAYVVIDRINDQGNRERHYLDKTKKKYKIEIHFNKGAYTKFIVRLYPDEKRQTWERFFRKGGSERRHYAPDGKTVIKADYDRNGNGIYDHFVIYKDFAKKQAASQYSLKDKDLEAANRLFTKGQKNDPRTWGVYRQARGKYHAVVLGYRREFADYIKEKKTLPEDVRDRVADALLGAGHCAFYIKDYSGALNEYHKVLALKCDPGYLNHAARSIAMTHIMNKDFAAAEKYLLRAIGYRPEDIIARDYLAFIYKQAGQYPRALAILKESLGVVSMEKEMVAPKWKAKIKYNLACFAALSGQKTKALHFLSQAAHDGYDRPDKVNKDPDLRVIAGSPAFKKALAAITANAQKSKYRRRQ